MASFVKSSTASATAGSASSSSALSVTTTSESIPAGPLTRLLVREKNGLAYYEGPMVHDPNPSVNPTYTLPQIPFPSLPLRIPPIFSPNGALVALVSDREQLALYDPQEGTKVKEFNITDAQKLEFSPNGRFLITWSHPSKGSATEGADGNLRVWDVESTELLAAYSQKVYKTDVIQFAANDSFCFRQVNNEIHVYSSSTLAPNAIVTKIRHQGYTQFKVAQENNSSKFNIAVFNPEAGGKPARVTLFSVNLASPEAVTVSAPLSSRTIFGATEAILMWNKSGFDLLVHSQSDIDSSNASYYGATGLYIMHANNDVSAKVEQTKEGPVHAAQWSPLGDRFVIAAGNMPCQCTMYNEKAEPVYQFGAAHRNAISWAPHGRFLMIAGFGNLAGEMDFYDIIRLKKIGSNVSHCATSFVWSPCSRYFMTASLAPRMNVDNGFKIFKYNGFGPILQQGFEKAYDAVWRPAPVDLYPNRPPSPRRGVAEDPTAAALSPIKPTIPAAAPYRPPGSTGALSDFMKSSPAFAAPVGKVKGETVNAPAKFVPSVQKQKVIPGMGPATAASSQKKKPIPGSAPTAQPQTASKPAAQPVTTTAKPAIKPSPAAAPAPVAAPAAAPAAETAESKEKRAKAIQKKLKQIQEIKQKVASGQAVQPDQLKRLSSEAELQRELDALK